MSCQQHAPFSSHKIIVRIRCDITRPPGHIAREATKTGLNSFRLSPNEYQHRTSPASTKYKSNFVVKAHSGIDLNR